MFRSALLLSILPASHSGSVLVVVKVLNFHYTKDDKNIHHFIHFSKKPNNLLLSITCEVCDNFLM